MKNVQEIDYIPRRVLCLREEIVRDIHRIRLTSPLDVPKAIRYPNLHGLTKDASAGLQENFNTLPIATFALTNK